MKHFTDPKKVDPSQKESGPEQKGVKASFKIEINDDEKKLRDGAQSIYHTGEVQKEKDLVHLEEDDLREIQESNQKDEDDQEFNDDDEDEDY